MKHPDEPMPEDDDEELYLMASSAQKVIICPLTAEVMENPVKSTCGHSFSRAAIMQLLTKSRGRQVNCPVPGCAQKVSSSSLSPDAETAAEIAKRQRSDVLASQRSQAMDEDVEDLV